MRTQDNKRAGAASNQASERGHAAGSEGRAAISRHLFEAIDLVRADVAKVEFWASAVEQFAHPVPEYDLDETTGWVPPESGTTLKRDKH
jgi:hypothetical protein